MCCAQTKGDNCFTDLKNTELLWGYWGQWTAPSAGDALLWFFIYLFHLDTFHKRLKLWTRLLFADLSTSNTRQPHILTEELKACFHFNSLWIIDFLSNRSQRVLVNNILSDTIPPLAPHKAVSFLLFCSSFTPRTADPQPNCRLVRFTEDTVLLSLLSGPTQHHGSALQEFVGWCESCCLSLELQYKCTLLVLYFLFSSLLIWSVMHFVRVDVRMCSVPLFQQDLYSSVSVSFC